MGSSNPARTTHWNLKPCLLKCVCVFPFLFFISSLAIGQTLRTLALRLWTFPFFLWRPCPIQRFTNLPCWTFLKTYLKRDGYLSSSYQSPSSLKLSRFLACLPCYYPFLSNYNKMILEGKTTNLFVAGYPKLTTNSRASSLSKCCHCRSAPPHPTKNNCPMVTFRRLNLHHARYVCTPSKQGFLRWL